MTTSQATSTSQPSRVVAVLLQKSKGTFGPASFGSVIASSLSKTRFARQQPEDYLSSSPALTVIPTEKLPELDVSTRSKLGIPERDLEMWRMELKFADLEAKVTRMELEAREERLRKEEERLKAVREDRISFFNGANNVSISGHPSFSVYYGQSGPNSWVLFVDAAGKEYQIPEYFTFSYEVSESRLVTRLATAIYVFRASTLPSLHCSKGIL